MKKHAIIPIFIPHRGCPNDCVFCNQHSITARQDTVTPKDAEQIIDTWLSTLEQRNLNTIEIAFFGGSFTGIPMEEQSAFLKIARAYKDAGRIKKIHLSTRPDYIDTAVLDNLRRYDVDVIELGVQSFDDDVLRTSGRGHNSAVVYESSRLIQEYGFTLGLQLMIGLPGDTLEKDIFSAREAVKIGPSLARLYPTVVLRNTALYRMYQKGTYIPMTEQEAVSRTKKMYKILDAAGIQIIRVGLKSSDIITDTGIAVAASAPAAQTLAGTFHPAFRQLVEGEIARESLEQQILQLFPDACRSYTAGLGCPIMPCPTVDFVSNEKSRNNLFGHKGCNRNYFAENYPWLNIRYQTDTQLADNQYLVLLSEN
ncbi:MAG: radical SAM protein [Firmicutes bacterium]|nr:radical SAM protein [Bacillota bacterium]